MTGFREVNAAAVALVKRHEGFSPYAYEDRAGVWTIGYGHTVGVKDGDVITLEQGEAFLAFDLGVAAACVLDGVRRPLNDNQFGALVSFVMNCGCKAFRESRLFRVVRFKWDCAVRGELSRWVHCTVDGEKIELPGLVRRRADEGFLYTLRPAKGA